MDSTFNMDFILGGSLLSPMGLFNGEINWLCDTFVADDKEENMLPDSSLSPSNNNCAYYMMDDSKLSDAETVNKSIDKNIITSDGNIHGRQCRLVTDEKGKEYWVSDAHLIPITSVHDSTIDNTAKSPSKECNTTFVSERNASPPNVYGNGDNQEGQILASFLYASQLALVEVKLQDLEKELSNLDKYSFSKFMNSPLNLNKTTASGSEQTFYPPINFSSINNFSPSDKDVVGTDDTRRMRLYEIMKKHSQLKRWLSKIKKKLKERDTSKLCHIIDFSSTEQNQLPLPEYLERRCETRKVQSTLDKRDTTSRIEDNILTSSNIKESSDSDSDSNLVSYMCNYRDKVDDTDDVLRSRKRYPTVSQEYSALSKDSSDPDGIPVLSYESDHSGDYTSTKCSSEDRVVSTDSDYPNTRNPPTPDLCRAELDCNDISEGIRVLVIQRDYLRAGIIYLTDNDDNVQKLWRVTFNGDRKCQDIIMSEWQLLEQGVREVIPTSTHQLYPGSRVCANWSVQLPMNLYPGTITLQSSDYFPSLNKLPIDFDDGDHKDVDLDQVRLLPESFPNLHELMQTSNLADSNFYSLDRKNRIKKKRVARLSKRVNNEQTCYKRIHSGKESVKIRKKLNKTMVKKKKPVVNWKLVKDKKGYKLMRNVDSLCIRGGESVQLLSYSRHNYLANVVSVLARHQRPVMEIEFNWYYILADVQDNSDIIKRLKKSKIAKKLLFKTTHSDINDVYSVLGQLEVLPFNEYKAKYMSSSNRGNDVHNDLSYVMAGTYDHSKTRVDYLDTDIRLFIMSGDD